MKNRGIVALLLCVGMAITHGVHGSMDSQRSRKSLMGSSSSNAGMRSRGGVASGVKCEDYKFNDKSEETFGARTNCARQYASNGDYEKAIELMSPVYKAATSRKRSDRSMSDFLSSLDTVVRASVSSPDQVKDLNTKYGTAEVYKAFALNQALNPMTGKSLDEKTKKRMSVDNALTTALGGLIVQKKAMAPSQASKPVMAPAMPATPEVVAPEEEVRAKPTAKGPKGKPLSKEEIERSIEDLKKAAREQALSFTCNRVVIELLLTALKAGDNDTPIVLMQIIQKNTQLNTIFLGQLFESYFKEGIKKAYETLQKYYASQKPSAIWEAVMAVPNFIASFTTNKPTLKDWLNQIALHGMAPDIIEKLVNNGRIPEEEVDLSQDYVAGMSLSVVTDFNRYYSFLVADALSIIGEAQLVKESFSSKTGSFVQEVKILAEISEICFKAITANGKKLNANITLNQAKLQEFHSEVTQLKIKALDIPSSVLRNRLMQFAKIAGGAIVITAALYGVAYAVGVDKPILDAARNIASDAANRLSQIYTACPALQNWGTTLWSIGTKATGYANAVTTGLISDPVTYLTRSTAVTSTLASVASALNYLTGKQVVSQKVTKTLGALSAVTGASAFAARTMGGGARGGTSQPEFNPVAAILSGKVEATPDMYYEDVPDRSGELEVSDVFKGSGYHESVDTEPYEDLLERSVRTTGEGERIDEAQRRFDLARTREELDRTREENARISAEHAKAEEEAKVRDEAESPEVGMLDL